MFLFRKIVDSHGVPMSIFDMSKISFRWNADKIKGAPALDTVTDFNNAAASAGGDGASTCAT